MQFGVKLNLFLLVLLKCADFQGLLQANVPRANVPKPTTPWMSFPALITILSRFLDASKMALINKCYKDFRVSLT